MAAPTEKSGFTSDSSEASSNLDPVSPHFNPREILYAESITLPNPDAKQFNNLSEFENFLQGTDAASLSLKPKQKKPPKRGSKMNRADAKAYEAERKAAIMGSRCAGPSERSAGQQRRRQPRNVLTRMENCTFGPLSVLSRCVKERLKVVVVVRAAVAVRSHCRAYVVAFDKHMNMALMDVDETYIRPIVKKKVEASKSVDTVYSFDDSVSSRTENLTISGDGTSSKTRATTTNARSHKTGHAAAAEVTRETSDKVVDLRTKLLKSRAKKGTQSDSEINTSRTSDINTSRTGDSAIAKRKDSSSNKGKSVSDSECNDGKRKPPKTEKSSYKIGDKFWLKYKEWAERRCYTQYDLLVRHVNQLFIRGDNVVSVTVADGT